MPIRIAEADKEIINRLEEFEKNHNDEAKYLHKKANRIIEILKKYNITGKIINNNSYSWFGLLIQFLLMLLLSPLFIYGLINNIIPYKIAYYPIKKIEDHMFDATIKYSIGTFIFPIFYLIMFGIVAFISDSIYIEIGYLFSLPLSAFFAHHFKTKWKLLTQKVRYQGLVSERNKEITEAQILRSDIENVIDELMAK